MTDISKYIQTKEESFIFSKVRNLIAAFPDKKEVTIPAKIYDSIFKKMSESDKKYFTEMRFLNRKINRES